MHLSPVSGFRSAAFVLADCCLTNKKAQIESLQPHVPAAPVTPAGASRRRSKAPPATAPHRQYQNINKIEEEQQQQQEQEQEQQQDDDDKENIDTEPTPSRIKTAATTTTTNTTEPDASNTNNTNANADTNANANATEPTSSSPLKPHLKTPNSYRTAFHPPREEMHPSKAQQSTTKHVDRGLILGFHPIPKAPIDPRTLTPSKIPVESSASESAVAKRQGQLSAGAPVAEAEAATVAADNDAGNPMNGDNLSEGARSLMETIRQDAARIKEQMIEENRNNQDNSNSDGASRHPVAQTREKQSRFDAAHAAEFRKMDSIDKHPSAHRPLLPRVVSDSAKRGSTALKRTASKARLDENDEGKPVSKIPTKRPNLGGKVSQTVDQKKDQPPTQRKGSTGSNARATRNTSTNASASSRTNTPHKRTQIPRASSAFQPRISRIPSVTQQQQPKTNARAPSLPGTSKTDAAAKSKPLANLDTPALKSILHKRQGLFSEQSSSAAPGAAAAATNTTTDTADNQQDSEAANAAAVSDNLSSRLLGIEPEGPLSSPRKHVEFSDETKAQSPALSKSATETGLVPEDGEQGEANAQYEIESSPSVGRVSSHHATPITQSEPHKAVATTVGGGGADGQTAPGVADIASDVTYPTLPPASSTPPPLSSPEPEEARPPAPVSSSPMQRASAVKARRSVPAAGAVSGNKNQNNAGVRFSSSVENTTPASDSNGGGGGKTMKRGPSTPHLRARRPTTRGASLGAYDHGLVNKKRHREDPQDEAENQEPAPAQDANKPQQQQKGEKEQQAKPAKRVMVRKTEPVQRLPAENKKPTTTTAGGGGGGTTAASRKRLSAAATASSGPSAQSVPPVPPSQPLGPKSSADVQPSSASAASKNGASGSGADRNPPTSTSQYIPGSHSSARAASRLNRPASISVPSSGNGRGGGAGGSGVIARTTPSGGITKPLQKQPPPQRAARPSTTTTTAAAPRTYARRAGSQPRTMRPSTTAATVNRSSSARTGRAPAGNSGSSSGAKVPEATPAPARSVTKTASTTTTAKAAPEKTTTATTNPTTITTAAAAAAASAGAGAKPRRTTGAGTGAGAGGLTRSRLNALSMPKNRRGA